jgi:hypothetical protein
LKKTLIITIIPINISWSKFNSYLSFFLKKTRAFKIKRAIIITGDICFTEKPKKPKITKNSIKKKMENHGINQKA